MRFLYRNNIDMDGVVVTASSEIQSLPATNVIDEAPKRVWRTKPDLATEWIKFDLGVAGAAYTVRAVVIHNHNLQEDDTDIFIEGNATDDFTAPSFSEQISNLGPGTIGQYLGSTNAFRWWRLRFTKWGGDISSRQIGRIYIGEYLDITDGPDFSGFDRQNNDLSRKQESLGGQVFSEHIDKYQTLKTVFSKCRESSAGQMRLIYDELGETTPLFVNVAENVQGAQEFWYVKMAKPIKSAVAGYDSQFYWDMSIDFREVI